MFSLLVHNGAKAFLKSQFIFLKPISLQKKLDRKLKSPLSDQIYLVKVPLNVSIVKQDLLHKKQFLKTL